MLKMVVNVMNFMHNLFNIRPDSYGWLLPPHDPVTINTLVNEGKFNGFSSLMPALGYCVFFGIARVVLTATVFKVRALSLVSLLFSKVLWWTFLQPLGAWAMKLPKPRDFDRIPSLDTELKKLKLKNVKVGSCFSLSVLKFDGHAMNFRPRMLGK
jgi:hypothetical protein